MAINKKNIFEAPDVRLADLAKALSHPARIAILRTVAEKRSCICGEIVDVLPLAQSTVSQHLKELKNVGLIQGEVEGKKSCYCIDWKTVEELDQLFEGFSEHLKKQNINCC